MTIQSKAHEIATRICSGQIVTLGHKSWALESVFERCRQSSVYQDAEQMLNDDESGVRPLSHPSRFMICEIQKAIFDRCLWEIATEAADYDSLPRMCLVQAA